MKEILEQIDNWTLLKLVGGLTVILSSLISFTAYFIKDFFLNKWKKRARVSGLHGLLPK
jgi:hypothetical protein